MEIKIRNINPVAIAKIDETAKRKKLSRNELLRIYIESYAIAPELKEVDDRYNNLITKIVSVIEKNNQLIEEMQSIIREVTD